VHTEEGAEACKGHAEVLCRCALHKALLCHGAALCSPSMKHAMHGRPECSAVQHQHSQHLDGHQDGQRQGGGLGLAGREVVAGVLKGDGAPARGVRRGLRVDVAAWWDALVALQWTDISRNPGAVCSCSLWPTHDVLSCRGATARLLPRSPGFMGKLCRPAAPTHLKALPLAARLPVAQLRKADGGVAVLHAQRREAAGMERMSRYARQVAAHNTLQAVHVLLQELQTPCSLQRHAEQRTWDRSMPRKEVEVYQVAKEPTVAKPT